MVEVHLSAVSHSLLDVADFAHAKALKSLQVVLKGDKEERDTFSQCFLDCQDYY